MVYTICILRQIVPGLCRGGSFEKMNGKRNQLPKKSIDYRQVFAMQKQWIVEVARHTNEQMAVEMPISWHEKCMRKWPNQPRNQWIIEWNSDPLNQRINTSIAQRINHCINNESMKQWISESMKQSTSKWMLRRRTKESMNGMYHIIHQWIWVS